MDKFKVCFNYLNDLSKTRIQATPQTTEKAADYMSNYHHKFKDTLNMYWTHLNLSIQDEYFKVNNNDLILAVNVFYFVMQVFLVTRMLENIFVENNIVHAGGRKDILANLMEANIQYNKTKNFRILNLKTSMSLTNQGNYKKN